MHLVAERFVFEAVDTDFLKERVKTYLMTPVSPLDSQIFSVFTSIVHGTGAPYFQIRSPGSTSYISGVLFGRNHLK